MNAGSRGVGSVKPNTKKEGAGVRLALLVGRECGEPIDSTVSKAAILHVTVRDVEGAKRDRITIMRPVILRYSQTGGVRRTAQPAERMANSQSCSKASTLHSTRCYLINMEQLTV